MNKPERDDDLSAFRRRPWYAADVVCVVLLLAYITLIHSGYLVWYLGGLRNRPPFMADPYIWGLILVTPVAAVCLIALGVRLALSWPRHIHDARRLLKLRLFVILGLVLYAGLHFVPLPASVEDPFLLGYREYAQPRIDVSGIQTWLATLDPSEWMKRGSNGRLEYRVIEADRSAWSEIILALRPDVVRSFLDDRGRPAVSLGWSRLHDSWGLGIGPPDMEIKPQSKKQRDTASASCESTPYRLPLAPGAYVWHVPH